MDSKRKSRKKHDTDHASELKTEIGKAMDPECEDLSDRILEHLPHLADEMHTSDADVRIDGVRWEETNRTRQPAKAGENRFSGYSPDVIDFLRRCTTQDEALEIISFLEKRGEINAVHAEELREQLRSRGLRSFGTKKSWGYYEQEDS
jgi:hypothetical protein